MPRVLLLLPTTTYRAEAFMQAARRLGGHVTVGSEEPSTMSEFNPSGLVTLDFKNPARAAEQVQQFAADYPISAIVPVDDQVATVGAAISNALNLPCNPIDGVRAARDKFRMRERIEAAGVLQPRFRLCSFNQDIEQLGRTIHYPCVIKPLDLAASQGVMRANHLGEFVTYAARLATIVENATRHQSGYAETCESQTLADKSRSKNRQFLVEQFVPGPEVAVEGILSRGR